MKHRASFIAMYLCLLLAFTCGMAELLFADKDEHPSAGENRMLQGFPALTAESVSSGAFMDGFENWLSDAFFFRERAAAFSDGVTGLFALPAEEAESALPAPAFEITEEERQEIEEMLQTDAAPAIEPEPDGTRSAAETVASGGRLPTPDITQDASLWVEKEDGTRQTMESFPAANLATLTRTLNEYRAVLPEDGTVHLINPPVTNIANKVMQYHTAAAWGSDLEDVLQPAVDEGVYIYDLTDILTPYIGQYDLYPTIDHHWHPISVKLAQSVMLQNQGVISNGYDEYLYWLSEVHDAGPFDTETLKDVTYNLELVPILVPNSPTESYMVKTLGERSPGVVIVREGYAGYNQYLGGNRHPWREFVTGFHTGRNALVIGDSFDLCFTAYLFPYYDTIMVTDFRDGGYPAREVGATVQGYLDYYGISDVYIVYCTYTSLNSETVLDRMERFLLTDYSGTGG